MISLIRKSALNLCSGIVAWSLLSCNSQPNNNSSVSTQTIETKPLQIHHAKGFNISYHKGYKLIEVTNPWDTSQVMYRYALIPRSSNKPELNVPAIIIETPVNSMACLFTTQLGYAKKLGVLSSVTGMSRETYVKDEEIRKRIEEGKIALFGQPENPDFEKLIAINPEILMVSPFKDNKYQPAESAGIPLAVNSSYMESTPLGRAEWIKFMATFFDLEERADSIFRDIESRYLAIKAMTDTVNNKPSIFTGRTFRQVWHVAGANSYMGNYLRDAGFNYIWSELNITGSIPYDFESVYAKAAHSDFWSFVEYSESAISYQSILEGNSAYADFDAYKNQKVLICNSRETPYFEIGILEPHLVLSDFVKAAHPHLLPGYTPKYFKPL